MQPLPNSAISLLLLVRTEPADLSKDPELQNEVLAVFESSRAGLLRYLKYLGVHDRNAEEVVQEVFLALFQLSGWDGIGAIFALGYAGWRTTLA